MVIKNPLKFFTSGNGINGIAEFQVGDTISKNFLDSSLVSQDELNNQLATKADLVNGKLNSSQVPAGISRIVEANNFAALPATGVDDTIYITKDNELTYRWGGTGYVEISPSIALGETISTAYRGDRGKIAYEHSQASSIDIEADKTSTTKWAAIKTLYDWAKDNFQPIGNYISATGAAVLTNKRINSRVLVLTNSTGGNISINFDNYDDVEIMALSAPITGLTITGTPAFGETHLISITDNGTAKAINLGALFVSSTKFILPTTTVAGVRTQILVHWSTQLNQYVCVGVV